MPLGSSLQSPPRIVQTINVRLRYGIVEDIYPVPIGTKIVVFDYDIDSVDPKNISEDEDGVKCVIQTWSPGPLRTK